MAGRSRECDATVDPVICVEEGDDVEALVDRNGVEIDPADVGGSGVFGVIDKVDQDNESFGGSVQAVDRGSLFGFRNQFLVGTSWDHGQVSYQTETELGTFGPKFVVNGSGIILGGDDFFGRDIDTTSDYFGVYFTNTTDLTDRLALTFRWPL